MGAPSKLAHSHWRLVGGDDGDGNVHDVMKQQPVGGNAVDECYSDGDDSY